jgi:hypothetical protein
MRLQTQKALKRTVEQVKEGQKNKKTEQLKERMV